MNADVPNKPLSFQGSGPSQETSNQDQLEQRPATEQSDNGPRYLTVEDAQALFDQLFDRKAQSIGDRTAHRVKKVLDAAQAQGAQMTPQQARALLDVFDAEQAENQAQRPANPRISQPAQAGQPARQESPVAPEADHVYRTADAIQARAGITIEDGDPEVDLIPTTDDELEFLNGIRAAVEAKKERLQTSAPARTPSVSSGQAGGGGKAALTAELLGLLEEPAKNRARIKEVKALLSKYN